jgi:nitrogen-specific signal transduction histidine kinase
MAGKVAMTPRPEDKRGEPSAAESQDALTCELRAPLTSIRAAAEILRDFPNLNEEEKSHFLDILLAEEARLETLVSELEIPEKDQSRIRSD